MKLLSLKTDGNVPTVSNKQKNLGKKLIKIWRLERKEQDPDRDPVPYPRVETAGPDLYLKVTAVPDNWQKLKQGVIRNFDFLNESVCS
jgi:hypothetical protein